MTVNIRRRTGLASVTGLPRFARNDKVGTMRPVGTTRGERAWTHRLGFGYGIAALRSQ